MREATSPVSDKIPAMQTPGKNSGEHSGDPAPACIQPPTADFVRTYAQYADVMEAPREMHEAVAIQLLATVLNRSGVTIRHGGLRYSLDLWQVLLSGSGLGRTTLMGLAEVILE